MKYRIVSVILLFVLLISFSVQAMNFNVDEVFDSVVVIAYRLLPWQHPKTSKSLI